MAVFPRSFAPYLDIARGLNPLATVHRYYGRNANVGVGSADVWGKTGNFVPPLVAQSFSVYSDNQLDDVDDSGAQSVVVVGLDDEYVLQSETVVLQGQSPVATVNEYIFINEFYVNAVGVDGSNVGNISIDGVSSGLTVSYIPVGQGRADQAIYMIPANTQGYIMDFASSAKGASGANIRVELLVKPFEGTFQCIESVYLGVGPNPNQILFPAPYRLEEKTLVKVRCSSDVAASDVSASFTLVNCENNLGV